MIFIKRFDDHSDYTTFTGTTAFTLPNVSRCTEDDHVHFNPLPLPAEAYIYTGDTLIESVDLYFDDVYGQGGEYTYHTEMGADITLGTPYDSSTHEYAPFDRVEINLFVGAENVSLLYESDEYVLTWHMKGDKLIVDISWLRPSYTNMGFTLTYTTSQGTGHTFVKVNEQFG